jgi:hypothetical protein
LGAFGIYVLVAILLSFQQASLIRTAVGSLVVLVLVVALNISIFALPWAVWFPGTTVYTGSASFIERHAAMIGVLGLIVGLASLVLAMLPVARIVTDRRTSGSDEPPSEPAA